MVATKSTTTTATAGLGGQPLEVNNNVKQRHVVKTSNNGINNDSDIIKDNHDIAKLDISALSEDIHSSDGNTTSASDVSDNYDRTSEESLNDDDHDVIDSSDGGVDPYADGIEVTGVEQWLCVSRLPPDLTEADFYDLLREFGGVKHYFLVFSEETGMINVMYHKEGRVVIPTLTQTKFFYKGPSSKNSYCKSVTTFLILKSTLCQVFFVD